ncbi:MAG: restriction endonuclease [Deltaproteobacteria bacterium]|nr:restriction endonuclease [Deltaproteobacteria bacterium]
MDKKRLTVNLLQNEANIFAKIESEHNEKSLFGITDGKAIGSYFEHKFHNFLLSKYNYIAGSSAKGIDFPELSIDMKITSIKQPQSLCPYRNARQKIFGLGYSLIVFVYEKTDNNKIKTGRLNICHTIFIEKNRTADFQTTKGLNNILKNDGNIDDIIAFFQERMLPIDEIQERLLAEEVLNSPPRIGYLTISNALQWRLQYSRIIQEAGNIKGIIRIL